jgi:penicillin-binding protein 2
MFKEQSDSQQFGFRIKIAAAIGYLIFGLLIFRVWYLQGVKGAYFRDQSENNRIRTVRTTPARGVLFDRDGRILVNNRPSFNIALMLEDVPKLEPVIEELSALSSRDKDELMRRLRLEGKRRPFEPRIVIPDVSRAELAKIKAHTYELPGVIVDTTPTRTYPYSSSAVQVLGYAREISKDQLEQLGEEQYRSGDIIGQSGIEKSYEQYLRGKSGFVQVEVDARGNRRGELGIVDSISGKNVYLTLDTDLQLAAEAALGEHNGAVVAVDPNNGEILALVSAPRFDANIFSGQMSLNAWESVSQDADKPLTNRAISQVYPPGSTIKLIYSVAGLAEKKITPQTEVFCPGYITIGKRRYHCHKREGHGAVHLREAISLSCNVYFYKLGQALGVSLIHKYTELFGLGRPSGIELGNEAGGTIPSEQWKLKHVGEKWYPGDTIPISIGQGYLTVTPLQLAMAISVVANGGTLYSPKIIKKVVDPVTGKVKNFPSRVQTRTNLPSEYFSTVRQFASEVVNGERGTGKRARIEGIEVAGKTGTAQVSAIKRGGKKSAIDDHAWFVAFAPAENPMIVLTILVEHGGGGGLTAAPMAKQILEAFFTKRGMIPPKDIVVEELPNGKPTT